MAIYDFLESKINWKNLFYQLAKLMLPIFKALNFYLTADGTPLKQIDGTHRITALSVYKEWKIFESYFASKKIIKWLNRNGFTWFTRIKKNRIIHVSGNKCQIQKSGLNYGESIVGKLNKISQQVKILRFCLQDEDNYICSNNIHLSNVKLKAAYLKRWQVEVFHREAKQKLGLEFLMMRSWKKLTNHVGFCMPRLFFTDSS